MDKYWHTKRGFRNPKGSHEGGVNILKGIRYLWSRVRAKPLSAERDVPDSHILSAKECLEQSEANRDKDHITWLGHCAFIIQLDGVRFLTDPFLQGSAGSSFIRGLRRLPCPLPFDKLSFDFFLISHQHADHLHSSSVRRIPGLSAKEAITMLKVGKKMKQFNLSEIRELDWFERASLPNTSVAVTALPACHYSTVPGNRTLWGGFMISSGLSGKKIYFSGDTAYGPFIKRDIAPYGPFDAALVGVGAYYLPFPSQINYVHTNPEEAVQVALDTRSKRLVGMHWGTVRMSEDNQREIPNLLTEIQKKKRYGGEITCMKMGETISI